MENSKFLSLKRVVSFLTISVLFFTSCEKQSISNENAMQSFEQIAYKMEGDIYGGTFSIKSNNEYISIDYNKGEKEILLQKVEKSDLSNLEKARIKRMIIGNRGIVIETRNGEVLYLINNDLNSFKNFSEINETFKSQGQILRIFGSTIIN